jgi:hypothetical protein
MTVIMEIAQMIREEEAALASRIHLAKRDNLKPILIDMRDSDQVRLWCRTFGTTPYQLCRAIDKGGSSDASVVKRQLLRR